jgi:lipoprotein-anchoring transpeptidase ErfK/SrfK
MKPIVLIRYAAAIVALAVLAGCEELETVHDRAATAIRSIIPPAWYIAGGHWGDEDVPGSPRIVVYLSEQKAYFYKGRHLIGETVVSTGRRGFSTPVGRYRIVSKDRDHISSEFGDYIDDRGNVIMANIDVRKDPKPQGAHFDGARMPYCMHFNGGYAMHEGYVPPYAASHCCIRLPRGMARHFFNAAREGTPVIVKK